MSNATQNPHKQGDSRRRNSRGGRNQQNQNGNRRNADRGHRNQGTNGQSEEFRPQSNRSPRGSYSPKLSWWQKLLKAIGLYKGPKPKQRNNDSQPKSRPTKSNTRNARSEDSITIDNSRHSAPTQGKPRERNRGGDSSTVKSPRVYVGNLSYDVAEQDLQELFKGVGPVRSVEVVYNRSTHRSKGYGFVEMLHMDDAIRCVEVLHDQHFMGRKLTVSGAKSKGQDERDETEDRAPRESRTVTLAPLPQAVESPTAPAIEPVAAEAPAETPVAQAVVAETPAVEVIQPQAETAPAVETKSETV